jgi:hypothetical protein
VTPGGRPRAGDLDPDTEFEAIYRISSGEDFGWETRRALELAILHTFAAPAIAEILDATGKFTRRGQDRYHDTIVMLREIGRDGLDSARGQRAIGALRRVHGHFAIDDDELRYVLATFVVIPVRWIARYGWRPLTRAEIRAAARYYSRLGALMGIRDVPGGYDDFAAVLDEYEARCHAPTPASQRLAAATIDVLAGQLRPLPRPVARWCVRAALDNRLRACLGLPGCSRLTVVSVHTALRARARVVRLPRLLAAARPLRAAGPAPDPQPR